MKSISCEAPGEHADVGDEDPCDGAGDGGLEVLGEAAAAAKPCEGPFNDPPARQHFEALGGIGSLDDLDRPAAELAEPANTGASINQTSPW
jgi:hypothetical protein